MMLICLESIYHLLGFFFFIYVIFTSRKSIVSKMKFTVQLFGFSDLRSSLDPKFIEAFGKRQ